jgi:hypothetical protein
MQTSGAMAPNGEAEVEKKLTIVFRTFLGYLTGIYVDPKNKNQRIGPYLATHVLFIYLFISIFFRKIGWFSNYYNSFN